MAVSCGLFVDRTAKVKHLDDTGRTQIKVFTDDLYQTGVGQLTGTEGVYHDGCGVSHTDSVGQLDLTFVSQAGTNDVFGYVTGCVSCGTVYLGAIFTGEGSAAVTGISAVGIYDDLASGQTGISVRSADNETAGGVDEEFCICIYHLCRKNRIKNIFFDVFMDLFLCHIRIMLCGQYDSIQTNRFVVFIIFNSNLSLSVRTQILQSAVFADFGQLQGQFVGQSDGIGHVLFGFVGGVTKHHTLIACTDGIDLIVGHFVFFGFQSFVYAKSDVRGLLIDRGDHAAGVCVKTIFSTGITDLTNGITYDFLNVNICICGDLTHNHDKACSGAGLTCHTAHGILGNQSIQNGIGNLVTHFVRMAFCYGFGCE